MANMALSGASHDPEYREATQQQVDKLLRGTPYHTLQLPDGTIITGLISIESLKERIASFPIPSDLRGRNLLDIGAASGWNSFEMLRRGASVTAVDCVEFEELTALRELFIPRIEYILLDVDELSPATIGTFDFVLFFGVLYHLRHPLRSLEKVCTLTKETAFVESFVCDPVGALSDSCSLEFYENDELGGQIDNWFGPTAKCLVALCRSAGFVRVRLEYVSDHRAGVTCHRRWEPEPDLSTAAPIWLYSAVNNRTNDIYFHPDKDEYLCIYFRTSETGLTPEQMRIEVDGYGINALTVSNRGDDEWQVNSRLPPGLTDGEHSVRLRTATTRFGKERPIVIANSPARTASVLPDATPQNLPHALQPAPVIIAIDNSLDHSNVFHGYRAERLCCRFRCGEQNPSRDTLLACIDTEASPQHIAFLTDLGDGQWQANISVSAGLIAGTHTLRLRTLNSHWSETSEFVFRRTPTV